MFKISSKTLRAFLQGHKYQERTTEGQSIVEWFDELDWSFDAAYQECIVCLKPHTRLNSQPRADGRHINCRGNEASACEGGLRLAADLILCQLCWHGMLDNWHKPPKSRLLTSKSADDWDREWKTSWRAGHLLLETKSILEFTNWRAVKAINWGASAVVDLLTGLCWYGCASVVFQLYTTMLTKLNRLDRRFSFWAMRRTHVVCTECRAVHVVGTQRHHETKTTVLHVSRKQDLSDARASPGAPPFANLTTPKEFRAKQSAFRRPAARPEPEQGASQRNDSDRFWRDTYPLIITLLSMDMLR